MHMGETLLVASMAHICGPRIRILVAANSDGAARRLPPPDIIEAFARHVAGAIYICRRFPSGRARVDYISDGIDVIYGCTPHELYANVKSVTGVSTRTIDPGSTLRWTAASNRPRPGIANTAS